MISSSIRQVELPELSTEGTSSAGPFSGESQSGRSILGIVDLRSPKVSTVDSVLFYTVLEGSPEVHYHLHSQVRAPGGSDRTRELAFPLPFCLLYCQSC